MAAGVTVEHRPASGWTVWRPSPAAQLKCLTRNWAANHELSYGLTSFTCFYLRDWALPSTEATQTAGKRSCHCPSRAPGLLWALLWSLGKRSCLLCCWAQAQRDLRALVCASKSQVAKLKVCHRF